MKYLKRVGLMLLVHCCGCGNGSMDDGSTESDDNRESSLGAEALEPVTVSNEPLAQEQVGTVFARARCQAFSRCSCEWTELVSCTQDGLCYDGEEDCVQRSRSAAERLFRGDAANYNAAVARECINAIVTSSCEDAAWFETCGAVFGVQAPASMEPPQFARASEPCSGTCAQSHCVISLGASGNTCSFEEGLGCQEGSCQPLAMQGEACSGELQCSAELACIQGACAPRIELGGRCSIDSEDPCVDGAYCGGVECVPLLDLGSPCNVNGECASGECNLTCVEPGQEPICGL